MPVLKSGLFVPLYLLEKEWWKRGTQSLTYVILRPGCLLFDHNCKRGFRMSFNSRSSFFFFPYLPCPLSLLSTRGAQLFIHSWLGNLVPPRRQCRERHTGLWERRGPSPWPTTSLNQQDQSPLCSTCLLGDVSVMAPGTGMLKSLYNTYCHALNSVRHIWLLSHCF